VHGTAVAAATVVVELSSARATATAQKKKKKINKNREKKKTFFAFRVRFFHKPVASVHVCEAGSGDDRTLDDVPRARRAMAIIVSLYGWWKESASQTRKSLGGSPRLAGPLRAARLAQPSALHRTHSIKLPAPIFAVRRPLRRAQRDEREWRFGRFHNTSPHCEIAFHRPFRANWFASDSAD